MDSRYTGSFHFDDLAKFNPSIYATQLQSKYNLSDRETFLIVSELSQQHDSVMRDEYALRDDTYYEMNIYDYLDVAERIGFSVKQSRIVKDETNNVEELLYELRYDNTVLVLHTLDKDIVDNAFLFYSLKLDEPIDYTLGLKGTLSYDDFENGYVWNGVETVIEGLRHFWNKAVSAGGFVKLRESVDYAFVEERFGCVFEDCENGRTGV